MDLVDKTLQEIRERKALLSAAVREFAQLSEADKLLTDAFGPLKRSYTRRTYKPSPKQEISGGPVAPRSEMRLNVQTLTQSPKEFEDREVAHVTQEPA